MPGSGCLPACSAYPATCHSFNSACRTTTCTTLLWVLHLPGFLLHFFFSGSGILPLDTYSGSPASGFSLFLLAWVLHCSTLKPAMPPLPLTSPCLPACLPAWITSGNASLGFLPAVSGILPLGASDSRSGLHHCLPLPLPGWSGWVPAPADTACHGHRRLCLLLCLGSPACRFLLCATCLCLEFSEFSPGSACLPLPATLPAGGLPAPAWVSWFPVWFMGFFSPLPLACLPYPPGSFTCRSVLGSAWVEFPAGCCLLCICFCLPPSPPLECTACVFIHLPLPGTLPATLLSGWGRVPASCLQWLPAILTCCLWGCLPACLPANSPACCLPLGFLPGRVRFLPPRWVLEQTDSPSSCLLFSLLSHLPPGFLVLFGDWVILPAFTLPLPAGFSLLYRRLGFSGCLPATCLTCLPPAPLPVHCCLGWESCSLLGACAGFHSSHLHILPACLGGLSGFPASTCLLTACLLWYGMGGDAACLFSPGGYCSCVPACLLPAGCLFQILCWVSCRWVSLGASCVS